MTHNDFSMKNAKRDILKMYFMDKFNVPPAEAVSYFRSTQEIRDELLPMVTLSEEDILEYMNENEFAIANDEDGSVKWAMWKEII